MSGTSTPQPPTSRGILKQVSTNKSGNKRVAFVSSGSDQSDAVIIIAHAKYYISVTVISHFKTPWQILLYDKEIDVLYSEKVWWGECYSYQAFGRKKFGKWLYHPKGY